MTKGRLCNVVNNTFWDLSYYLIVVFLGFLAPKYIILIYGSSVNGLSATITQILNVILLLQAGAATAAVYSLYRPIADENIAEVNTKLSSARAYFRKLSFSFLVLMTGAAIVTAFSIRTEMSEVIIFVAFFIMGLKTFLDLYFTSTYRILFTAYQEKFVISIATLSEQVIYYMLVFVTFYYRWHFILLFFWLFLGCVFKILYLNRAKLQKHPEVKMVNSKAVKSSINGKNFALANEVSHSVMSTSTAILISFMYGLKETSVYSVYMLIFSALYLVLTSFYSSFAPSFGSLLASGNMKKSKEVFAVFCYIYLAINTIMMMCTVFLLLPFVTLYTEGVNDMDYNNEKLIILLVVSATFSAFRIPYNIIVSSLGLFKETWLQPVITVIASLLISYLAGRIDYAYILLGPVVFYATNFLYQYYRLKIIVPYLIGRNVFVLLFLTLLGLSVSFLFYKSVIWEITIASWIGMAFAIFLFSLIYVSVISLLFVKPEFMLARNYMINIFKGQRA